MYEHGGPIMNKIADFSHMPVQRGCNGEDIHSFSDTELLAVILGTGSRSKGVMECAETTLRSFGGLKGMFHSGLRELSAHNGIGMIKAVRIKCAFEMGRRILSAGIELTHISSPESVWLAVLPETAGLQKEEFRVLVLNSKNRILKKSVISVGTVSETIVHPREVFRDAIREGGSGIIITHNHPSGTLVPSKEDIATTERIAESGRIIGIPLLDHVIVTDNAYYSMKEGGYI
jgi:DNA repair protein RadC